VVVSLALLFASFESFSAVTVASLVTVPLAVAAVFTTSRTILPVPWAIVPRLHSKTVVDRVIAPHAAGALTAVVCSGTALLS
jgi:hypothetical protein